MLLEKKKKKTFHITVLISEHCTEIFKFTSSYGSEKVPFRISPIFAYFPRQITVSVGALVEYQTVSNTNSLVFHYQGCILTVFFTSFPSRTGKQAVRGQVLKDHFRIKICHMKI